MSPRKLSEEVIVQGCHYGGVQKLTLKLEGEGHKYREWRYSTSSREVGR